MSVHDEVAIRNDLDAIQAGASHAPAGIAEGLARLAALHREGVLTGQVADRIGVVIQAAFHDPGREDRIQSGLRATAPATNLERITTTFFS
ncbi:MAG: hypothetical protein KFB96_04120 [Thiocapsa sp.]|uniref:hypothetical protein n=1 Tax=Thiocapsa sp. TaxID=2024551 RepID=UPI001BD04320|nr:hypothetical protein [Thiocapsa sp.]QVL49698.1 MAG: hypothetical protein KFB96_04120 [Thiocapsa sp.]